MRKILQFIIAAGVCAGCIAASPLFTFDLNGNLSGVPGSTVGWGLSVTDSNEFVTISQSAFCLTATQESDLGNCPSQVQAVGLYTDFSGINFFVVGPPPEPQNVTQVFDSFLQTGYGSFAIKNSAAQGTVSTGVLAIIYQLYSGDPLFGGPQVGGDNFIALPASVTVLAAVPEPGTLLPACFSFGAFAIVQLLRIIKRPKIGI